MVNTIHDLAADVKTAKMCHDLLFPIQLLSTIIKQKWTLSTSTDYHNQHNVTVSLLTNKAKAHSFYSDMEAEEGGEKKGFKVSSGQFASLTVCHSFGNSKSIETCCLCCQTHH
jgi:hypothetical protein